MPAVVDRARLGVVLAALAVLAAACAPGRSTADASSQNPATADASRRPSTLASEQPSKTVKPPTNPTAPGPGGPASPGGARPTAAPASEPTCAAGQLTARTRTNQASYHVGEPVTITGTVSNTGTQSCAIGLADDITITDEAGSAIYHGSFPTHATDQLEPGKSRTTTFTWEQQSCGPDRPGCLERAKPGRHTVAMRWTADAPITASSSFAIA